MSNIRMIRRFCGPSTAGQAARTRITRNIMVPSATLSQPIASPALTRRSEVNMTRVTAQSEPSSSTHEALSPTPELLDHLAAESHKLESATPWEIIQWAVDHYFPKLTMATAFGPEGCVIIHML